MNTDKQIAKAEEKARRRIIIKQLVLERLRDERVVLTILCIAIFYALVSNILLHVPPLRINPILLDMMASLDDVIRNCCYGVVASIAFYFLNDYYKKIESKVDEYCGMYPDLYELWLKVYQLVLALSNQKCVSKQNQKETIDDIVQYVCKNNIDSRDLEVEVDIYHTMLLLWTELFKEKKKFLEVYGNTISREEYFKLNDNEYATSLEILNDAMPKMNNYEKGMTVSISSHYLQRTIYLIVKYKSDLAKMVNKYSRYYYGNQRGIRTDAF